MGAPFFMYFLVAGFFLVLAWLVPLHFPPWVSFHSEAVAFLAVALLAWAAVVDSHKKKQVRALCVPALVLPFIGLGLLALIQNLTGLLTFVGDALVFSLYMFLCIACITIGFAAGRPPTSGSGARVESPPEALAVLAWVLVAGAFFSAILAFIQALDLFEQAGWISQMMDLRRPGANLAQPNQLATLLLMGVASLLYLHACDKLSGWTAVLVYGVLCTALAATESRTGALNFLLLSLWCMFGRSRGVVKISPWLLGVALITFFALFRAWPALISTMGEIEPGAKVDTQPGLRLVVWPQLWEAVTLRPWWGWGLLGVAKAHNSVASHYVLSEPYTYAHNIVLDMSLGMGLLLTALFAGVIAVWLWRRVASIRSVRAWFCLATVLPVAIHSMLEFPFAYAYFLVPVMLLLGVLERACGARTVLRLNLRLAAVVLLLPTIVGAWSAVEYFRIEEDFRVVRFESLRVGTTPVDYQPPEIYLLTQLGALIKGGRIRPVPGMSAAELELARDVALRYPWPATQNRYALALALNGNPVEAQRQLHVLLALHGTELYGEVKENWMRLTKERYPQLARVTLP